jgi:uncharacterized hydrophobic protein (TIGR00271 family)
MGILRRIAEDNKITIEDLPKLEAKLFFEGPNRLVDLEQYVVLLFLATVIATFGVLADSTATVIGAMIIAPLMRPIMATAAGLVMGDMKRAGTSFLIVVLSVAGVIGVAWLLTLINFTAVVSIETNSQITGRVSPSLLDLFAALAAGAAGAFAMSREDVADSLPGVAISISLVPPICVVGVALAQGEWIAAWGAMLLFSTNFLSILLAGGGVLAALGLSAAATKQLHVDRRRRGFFFVVLGVLLITVPLGATSFRVFGEGRAERATRRLAQEWLDERSYEINQVDADGNQVTLIIHGSGDRPALSELGTQLGASLDRSVEMKLIVVPSEREVYVVEPE